MTHEKDVTLETGRAVKLIMRASKMEGESNANIEYDVLIKDPKDTGFHLPIENNHPKYWKIKSLNPEKSRMMQIEYSGIQDKQIRKALKEFREIIG